MKKLLLLVAAFALTLTLAGCNGKEELAALPDEVTMANVDEYLGRPDVQYVDLRNFDEKMKSGYILGFEVIPYFDYLQATDILAKNASDWTFVATNLKNENALKDLFDMDKAIFLMCGSGTRAAYVKSALESIGFENVYNVGGFADYDGDNAVAGDGMYNVVVELPLPTVVDMTNIDMYLGRSDVQYVDLRNFDDKMKSGYIAGFEMIPFFDYLEYEGILVRTDGNFTFAAEDILSQAGLRGLFTQDKTIFLMCGSGTRAGYVKEALESLGYDNVYNVGGIGSYAGNNLVLGDDTYTLDTLVKGEYTPGTYFGNDPIGGYMATVIINDKGGIGSVTFDAVQGMTTKQNLQYDYGMKARGATYEWFEHANMLADYIVANQGWGDISIEETAFDSTWNALTVPHHIIEFDAENNPDSVAGVTIGAEGFVFAWNAAISQASTTDLGVVAIDITPAEWAAAHAPAMDLVDGVYFGLDEASGYNVKVTIVDSFITEVFFDAIYGVYQGCDNGSGVVDPLVDKATCSDEWEVYVQTTKQVLQDGYTLASGITWAAEANELAAAIVKYQEWRAEWAIVPSGSHDKFDVADAEVILDVAGVTIGVEGFLAAWEEAIAQAQPVAE